MYGSIVAMFNIWKNITLYVWLLGIVHVKYVHDHLVDNLYLAISLGVEGSGFGELGFQL